MISEAGLTDEVGKLVAQALDNAHAFKLLFDFSGLCLAHTVHSYFIYAPTDNNIRDAGAQALAEKQPGKDTILRKLAVNLQSFVTSTHIIHHTDNNYCEPTENSLTEKFKEELPSLGRTVFV